MGNADTRKSFNHITIWVYHLKFLSIVTDFNGVKEENLGTFWFGQKAEMDNAREFKYITE